MNVLVTGGAGFIGSHVVDKLRDRGINVLIYDLAGVQRKVHRDDVTFVPGSILDLESLRVALSGVDVVFHLAAVADVKDVYEDPVYSEAINVRGSINVLEAARRAGDLQKMSELQYGRIPELEKQLASANEAETSGTQEFTLLRNKVTEDEIAEVVSKWTGVPVSKMLEGERDKLLRMEEVLHNQVVGQDQAIKAVSNAVRRSRAGLSDPNRPNGSFLFLGPTGVGKTELCKALATFLFDSKDAMVRIDMSEYMEKHSVARLIGAPPGYVGYEEGGLLTEAVRRKPYSVILLDEVEKAHPDVFNILLQVLDDGQLTDGQGRKVDFKNCVLVMTSNLGSDVIQTLAGDDESSYEMMREAVMEIVGSHFRPEFINRIDEAVVFHPLQKDQIRGIADIQLDLLRGRLKERDLSLELSDAAVSKLVDVGYDPVYGARPLKRAIQQWIENPLAQDILSGKFMPGSTIVADVDGDHLVFNSN